MTVKAKLVQGGDGSAIPSGMVGEVITSSKAQSVGTSSAGVTLGTFAGITKGRWRFDFKGTIVNSSGLISKAGYIVQLTTNNSLNPTISDYYNSNIETTTGNGTVIADGANNIGHQTSTSIVLDIAADATYYLRGAYTSTGGGSIGLTAYGQATRIA